MEHGSGESAGAVDAGCRVQWKVQGRREENGVKHTAGGSECEPTVVPELGARSAACTTGPMIQHVGRGPKVGMCWG